MEGGGKEEKKRLFVSASHSCDCSNKHTHRHERSHKKIKEQRAKATWTNIDDCAPIPLGRDGVCEVYFVIVWKMAYLSETVKGRRFIKLGAIRKSYRHIPIKWKACNIQETRDGSRAQICVPHQGRRSKSPTCTWQSVGTHTNTHKTTTKQSRAAARCPRRVTSRVTRTV